MALAIASIQVTFFSTLLEGGLSVQCRAESSREQVKESAHLVELTKSRGGQEHAHERDRGIVNGDVVAEQALALVGWIRHAVSTYHHPVATCAMGPYTDHGAVTDARVSV